MRVVSGSAGGIQLEAPKDTATRPTSDKAKEGVFNALRYDIEGARVLDVFAGSGAMGIEALSCGAKSCVFVDAGDRVVRCIRANLAKTHLDGKIVRRDAISYLSSCRDSYDIIFSDPPYNKGWTKKLIPLAEKLLSGNGLLVCETDKSEPRPEATGALKTRKEYVYGRVYMTVFEKTSK